MDPALQELLEGDAEEEIEALIKLSDAEQLPAQIRQIARFGSISTCRIKRHDISDVWEDKAVVSLKAPRFVAPEIEVDDIESAFDTALRDSDIRRPASIAATGHGIVIGLIDVGCDFAHPNFRESDGSTRLLALWDQSAPSSDASPRPYGYGVSFSRDEINRALAQADPYSALGYHPGKADPLHIGAHGTLVLDIAAGNGRVPGSPSGIAPEADLVFIHVSSGAVSNEVSLGDSVRVLEGLDYICQIAGNRPLVVNISLGRRAGPHDGSSLVEQAMDAFLLDAPNRAIIFSTGNYFAAKAHAHGHLHPGKEYALTWRIDQADVTPNELEIWYSGKDTFAIEIKAPGAGAIFSARLGESIPIVLEGQNVGHLYHRQRDPNNGDNHVDVFLKPGALGGDWEVILHGIDVVDGKFHAWVERDVPCPHCSSYFVIPDVDPTCTTGTICNGLRTIAAGAFDAHADDRRIAGFSSCGPTRDERQKPDLIAPGVKILGARSFSGTTAPEKLGLLTRMSGTSFAAPHVTGTIALMFHAAGRPLPIEETRRLLIGSTLPAQADINHLRSGSGYLDIERALNAVRQEPAKNGIALQSPDAPPQFFDLSMSLEGDQIHHPPSQGVETRILTHVDEQSLEVPMLNPNDSELEDMLAETRFPSKLSTAPIDFVEIAEEAVIRGRVREARQLLPIMMGAAGEASMPISLAHLFDELVSENAEQRLDQGFQVIAKPGQRIAPGLLRAGDIFVRRAFGEPELSHVAVLTSGDLLDSRKLPPITVSLERSALGTRAGLYVLVIDGGYRPHRSADQFARRIAKPSGEVANDALILRLCPSAFESEGISPVEGKLIEDFAEPDQVEEAANDNTFHRIACQITGVFEGGKTSTLNLYDKGIISYGKHQATLQGGALYLVIKRFVDRSASECAKSLSAYLDRVKRKDETLRSDKKFIQLLKDAAADPDMSMAQDEVFAENYWKPTKRAAKKYGVNSALGHVVFYDLAIQGSPGRIALIAERAIKRLGGKIGDVIGDVPISEQDFLKAFVEERIAWTLSLSARDEELAKKLNDEADALEKRAATEPFQAAELNQRAAKKRQQAKRSKANSDALKISATKTRGRAFRELVSSGDLTLSGGATGLIRLASNPKVKIAGLSTGATIDNLFEGANELAFA